ncbi:ATP-binding protein [Sphaerisporangium corydalis]|nr:ATP-binding protein [Sphaerisporangium corydalis]
MTGPGGGLRVGCWDVPCRPASVSRVRRMVRDTCRIWDVPGRMADDLVLVVGELLGNAVVYGRPPVMLSLWSTGEELCVRVTDDGPEDPRRLDLGPAAPHGRGLTIVEALADRWGVARAPGGTGKTVWAAWHRPAAVVPAPTASARAPNHPN